MKEEDLYNINKYTDKQLYDILDMNNPTDRELEAKIIHLIKKYENMQNESGDKLAIFFQNIYDHFFNTDIEGFQNPTPDPLKTMDPSKFALSNDEEQNIATLKSANATLRQSAATISPNDLTTPQSKQIGYEAQQISSVQQFDYSADKLQLNPLLKQTIKRIISIDSQYRDIKTNPLTTNFSFDLSEPLKDVVSLKLYSVQIPYTWYTIPKSYGSNFIYLKGASAGINDGNHDYKLEIKSGNYTPTELESEINQRFYDISNNTPTQMASYDLIGIPSASDVNFNGIEKIITYTPNTSKMTMNIDLQKVYTESYYQMYFPNWSSPLSDNRTTIPSYIGFNNQTYNNCSIVSSQTLYTTNAVIGEVTQDYILNSTNNYFTVNMYSNDSIIESYKITLQNYSQLPVRDYTGLATRNEIVTAVNTTLQNYKNNSSENVFELASGITYEDIPINKENAGYRYYKLTIIFNRYVVKYRTNSRMEVVFPSEIVIPTDSNQNFTIWKYSTLAYHNCFFFENTINKFSEFTSESPAVYSSYTVDTSTNIILTCKKQTYNDGSNDISMNIPSSLYTLTGFTNAITQAFINYNNTNNQFTTFYVDGINKGAYIDPDTSKFTLTIDMDKKFSSQHYHLQFGNTSLLSGMRPNGSMYNYNIGPAWNVDIDLSSNPLIFSHSIASITSGYFVDFSYILTITPNQNIANVGNKNADPVDVYLNIPVPTRFTRVSDYIRAINNSILGTYVDTQRVFGGSSITSTYNPTTNSNDISLNIFYNYSLIEKSYDISFVNYTYPITSDSNIWKKLDISSNYDLSLDDYYTQTSGAYAIINGLNPVSGDELTLISGSNTIVFQPNLLSQYSIPNDPITLTIPPATYTINTLCNAINSAFNNEPRLYGSKIIQFQEESELFTKIILYINDIYTTKDYNIVFYDPVSFVKCYAGSRSVQNTTWDSTLGWILGFRDYTQYSLNISNRKSNNDGFYYYLNSINGKYIYNETTDSLSNLLTNVSINIEGDTTVSTNLYNYFLISLDDYIQNHLNDGLVTITRKETALSLPDYSYATTQICDPITNTLTSSITQQADSNNLSNKQLYSLNQSIYSQQNAIKTYSPGPFIKDLFGFIPIKPPSKNGDYYIEFGGSLQNQERLYFGPVNIRKMSIQLLNDRGDVVDLNNTNWSFSFICEQLYRASSS